ncbi:glycosyl hydrolase family 28-related protein [Acidimangrovimonas sediminis]|uniref:glycosyl hydrolase family 28-related protein n=1 Tax=Acidimangrovimonas sediminis TaxID=2056283 RepID=UPI000C80935E|nr:glycosyl hydrolase family 28-related protein [Acidimangrovimonas sediminis]
MDITITDGLALMPPAFAAGLNLWSRTDGTPGTPTWDGQANAALVAADADFGGCVEMVKTETTQRMRYMGNTPLVPGLYLRVTVRIKAVAGNLPSVRIAAWAGDAGGKNVVAADQIGPSVALTSYGEVVEVSAIIGAGNREGVDMVWGSKPVFGHFGFDLTGSNGGTLRIDDIRIEDATDVFARKLMDWVDVRDYGAVGDGTTDDTAAFEAADSDADGRSVLVSSGNYYLGGNVTFESPVRFEGTVTMPDSANLALTRNYDLATYEAAFGDELTGFRKALQALFSFTDHATLDLSGRRIAIDAPLDVAAIAGLSGQAFQIRRVLRNGSFDVQDSAAWDTRVVTSQATYATSNPQKLTGVANVSQIEVGSLVQGSGVGREIYVTARNVGAGTVTLSQPLYGGGGVRTYTFSRFRYVLDLINFAALSKFELHDIEFNLNGYASAIMMAPDGIIFQVGNCFFNKPKDRCLTSIGEGDQGMMIDNCQFLSNEQATPAQDRTSGVLNTNANDIKLRQNRVVRFGFFAVIGGNGSLILGNHFFHGDNEQDGVRRAGIVLTASNCKTTINGNYIDDCSIEWTNEYDVDPNFTSGYSFGGLTVEGNIFTVINVNPAFRFMVIKPYGADHYLQGFSMQGNVFKPLNGAIDRVEMVDTTFADLNYGRFRNIIVQGNSFNSVNQLTMSPVTLEFSQNSAASVWTVGTQGYMPFGGRARNVVGLVAESAIKDAGGNRLTEWPYVKIEQGADKQDVTVNWSQAAQGKVQITIRVDTPS